jgi:hypothetical protein
MKIHIGKQIKVRLLETGMSKSEFARRINKTSQNVYDIFDRKTIDTGLLIKISAVLDYNFFELYIEEFKRIVNEPIVKTAEAKEPVSVNEIVSSILLMEQKIMDQASDIAALKKEIAYLMDINGLLSGRNKI